MPSVVEKSAAASPEVTPTQAPQEPAIAPWSIAPADPAPSSREDDDIDDHAFEFDFGTPDLGDPMRLTAPPQPNRPKPPHASAVELPTIDLLEPASDTAEPVSEERLAETGQLIEQRLQEFKVPCR